MTEELLKISDVTKILGVSRTQIYSLIDDPKHPLPVIYISDRLPRFRKADIETWLETKRNAEPDNPIIIKSENLKGGEQ